MVQDTAAIARQKLKEGAPSSGPDSYMESWWVTILSSSLSVGRRQKSYKGRSAH